MTLIKNPGCHSLPRRLRLLLEEDCVCAVYSPSTMLASGSVASTAGAMVSAWGTGPNSSAAGVEPSSATAILGSSSSQDRSVDFLHSTQLVVNQVRLPNYNYSGKIFTYKLDRTTVTVGAPSMLAMSTSPASACACSSALVAAGSSAAGVAAGSVLPSATGACGLTSVTAGAGLRLPHRLLVAFVPLVYGVGRRNLLQATEFCRQHTQH
jgi:hypothetical protein